MLHTLSHTSSQTDSALLLSLINQQDIIVLWQDGVTIAVKGNDLLQDMFKQSIQVYALKQDISARGLLPLLDDNVILIDMEACIALTAQHYPQLAW
ncbi:sulfurtransferase complex subunit TusB [Utexia brackfieldae]|uniref:sulfurtransferase complex subunit TusB n=1 Tax=Utexia brackfieldae TaxID=3074108 RepID=UPI00370D9376